MAQMASCECVISKHDVALENMQADIGYMREGLQGTQQDVDALNQKVENLQSKVDSAVIGDLRSLHLEVRHIQETMACGGDMPKRHTQTTMSQTENAVADSPALNPRVSELQFSTPLPPSHERSCNKFGHYQRNCPRKPQRTPPDKVTAAVTGISTDTDNHLDQGNVRGEAVKQELGPSY
ncbi:UNVERIFIED_CONTAM: hypothetical protein FKN15_048784 [Acipenser sinensis]